MKKLIIMLALLLTPGIAFSAVGDFDGKDIAITKRSVEKAKISRIEINPLDKSADVYIVLGYVENDVFVSIDEYKSMRFSGQKYRQLMTLLALDKTKVPQIIQAVIDSQ